MESIVNAAVNRSNLKGVITISAICIIIYTFISVLRFIDVDYVRKMVRTECETMPKWNWNEMDTSDCQWKLDLLCLGLDLEQNRVHERIRLASASTSAALCNIYTIISERTKMRHALIKLNQYTEPPRAQLHPSEIRDATFRQILIINLRSYHHRMYQLKVKVIVITLHLDLIWLTHQEPILFFSRWMVWLFGLTDIEFPIAVREPDHRAALFVYVYESDVNVRVCLSLPDSYTETLMMMWNRIACIPLFPLC